MKILIEGTNISCIGDFTETEDSLIFEKITFPKHTLKNYQIVEADLPKDFKFGKYIWQDGFVLAPEPIVEQVDLVDVTQTQE